MRSIGWQPRAAGWFTKQVTEGFLGVIGIGVASMGCAAGTARITLYAGIRDEANEDVVAKLCGAKDGGYRQRSLVTSIGYLMPECQWRQWLITPANADAIANELAATVETRAEPYLHNLPSGRAALLDGVWHASGAGQPWGICRVVVYRALYLGIDQALAYLDEQLAALGSRTDLAAEVVREMAPRARAWLALPNLASHVADEAIRQRAQ
jgi:hypothetical protein